MITKKFFDELISTDLVKFMKKRGYVTVKDLMKDSGLPETTLRDRIRKGKYQGSVKIGHMYFVPKKKNKYKDDLYIRDFSYRPDYNMYLYGYRTVRDIAEIEYLSVGAIKDRIERGVYDTVKIGMNRYVLYYV